MSERPLRIKTHGEVAVLIMTAITALIGPLGCGGPTSSASGEPTTAVASTTSASSTTGASSDASATSATSATSTTGRATAANPPDAPSAQKGLGKPLVRPKGPLSMREAQQYALDLVNRDRKKAGLPPVEWNETAAKAGERQAKDMVRHGYTGHVGSDGSTPELRHTEAGGSAMVMENAACFGDGEAREIDPSPVFSVDEIDRIQKTFMEEMPPADGHKQNILKPWHTSVGIGFSKAKDVSIVCLTQEFLDDYGEHDALPLKAKVGDTIKVSGKGREPADIAAVGLARIDKPRPRTAAELSRGKVYPIPKPYVTYFPKGYKTPIPLHKNGSFYTIEVPLNDGGKPGLYEVSVWANVPQTKDLVMISLRTIMVN